MTIHTVYLDLYILLRVDSPADVGGLKKLDSVLRINGQNVMAASADMVAKFVRSSTKQIIIDVQRFVIDCDTVRTGGFATDWDTDSDTKTTFVGTPWNNSRISMLCQEGSDMDMDDDRTTLIRSPALRATYTSSDTSATYSSSRKDKTDDTACSSVLIDTTKHSLTSADKQLGYHNLCDTRTTINYQVGLPTPPNVFVI